MLETPRVLVVSPIPTDCVSSWRCLGPLSKMSDDIQVIVAGQNVSWVDLLQCDILFMHRPFIDKPHLEIMCMAKQYNKKIWVDYDDDLLNVMDDNPTYHNYGRVEVKEAVKKCLQLADIVTVTTQALKDLYAPYANDIRLAPNALDTRFITIQPKPIMTNTVLWRGSDSHQRDLLDHANALINTYREHSSDYKFEFIGYRPWFLLQSMPNAIFHGGKDFRSFYDYIGTISPDIVHVPLHNHVFNHGKSNIAAMEGSAAGAMIVGPDFEEWRIPGVLNYKNQTEYGELLNHAIKLSEEEKRKRRIETLEFFQTKRNLDVVNLIRLKVVEDLMRM